MVWSFRGSGAFMSFVGFTAKALGLGSVRFGVGCPTLGVIAIQSCFFTSQETVLDNSGV